MDHIIAAFRLSRGSFGRATAAGTDAEDDDGDDHKNNDTDENNDGPNKAATERSLAAR
jgi:hypothetical protein